MTRDKWLDLKDKINDRFEIEKQETGALEDVPASTRSNRGEPDSVVETLIFNGPVGKIKLEWISKPKTLGEKTTYSNRIGSDVKVDKIYSENERSEYIKAYKLDRDEWVEISSDSFNKF